MEFGSKSPKPAARNGSLADTLHGMETAAPTVLWRLCKVGRDHAHAVMLPGGPPYTLAFFANEQMDRVENFDAMDIALFRADEIKQSLTADGWHEE